MILWKLSPSFSSKDHPAKLQLQRLVVGSASNNFQQSSTGLSPSKQQISSRERNTMESRSRKVTVLSCIIQKQKHKYMDQTRLTRLKIHVDRKSAEKLLQRNHKKSLGFTGLYGEVIFKMYLSFRHVHSDSTWQRARLQTCEVNGAGKRDTQLVIPGIPWIKSSYATEESKLIPPQSIEEILEVRIGDRNSEQFA